MEGILLARNRNDFEAGEAWLRIRGARLYRMVTHRFDDYVRKWDVRASHVYRLIAAAGVMTALKVLVSPIGEMPRPANESQVRPLTRLQPEQQRRVWTEVVVRAGGAPITSALVQQVAAGLFPRPNQRPKRSEFLAAAIKALKSLSKMEQSAPAGGFSAAELDALEQLQARVVRFPGLGASAPIPHPAHPVHSTVSSHFPCLGGVRP
jgi:hypothetical protein